MIAKSREERLRKLYAEDEERIKEEVADYNEKLHSESKEADSWLAQEQEEIDSQIRLQDLERAIETALDNPVDHEFAIDLVTFHKKNWNYAFIIQCVLVSIFRRGTSIEDVQQNPLRCQTNKKKKFLPLPRWQKKSYQEKK